MFYFVNVMISESNTFNLWVEATCRSHAEEIVAARYNPLALFAIPGGLNSAPLTAWYMAPGIYAAA